MGMDLEPLNPSKDAPRYPSDDKYSPNEIIYGRYNWTGWSIILDYLKKWNVNTSEFAGTNDGDIISKTTCLHVADAIEKHLSELPEDHKKWLEPHIKLWRTCGGYAQW